MLRRMSVGGLPTFVQSHYEIREWRHASAILASDFPDQWSDLIGVLAEFRFRRSDIIVGGGGLASVTHRLHSALGARGWLEHRFETKVVVDQQEHISPTHKVDHVKGRVACDVEWNNKTEFYDRDLNNFRLLFELRAISVGIIITRCTELQTLFNELKIGKKYGASTTHFDRLTPRLEGGAGGGCPVIAFGISRSLYVED